MRLNHSAIRFLQRKGYYPTERKVGRFTKGQNKAVNLKILIPSIAKNNDQGKVGITDRWKGII